MKTKAPPPDYRLEFEAPSNGRLGVATILAIDNGTGKTLATDRANVTAATEREKLVRRLAQKLGLKTPRQLDRLRAEVEARCNDLHDQHRQQQAREAAGSPEGVAVERAELLDEAAAAISRPLCLINGQSYAAAWCHLKVTREQSDNSVSFAYEDCLAVVRRDGQVFAAAGGLPFARPLEELRLQVYLNATPPPERCWSGAGVKRYLAGDRPVPAEVFARVKAAVDRFIDFSRSLGPQELMCELVAAYVMATYLLDAFHVVGYLWPNGERGTGKTSFLQLVAELAYLGQLILAGSSYACLRDMADYGATLCFDDAENMMDVRRCDPDKRTLLLAGNRRGATVAVKELNPDGKRWTTRHVSTFCPRLFSAIRLPDDTLGSRSIIVPLVRSGDEGRAKANPLDPLDWPLDRRRMVDDLWAVGLSHLPDLPAHDRAAAAAAELMGRPLDAWRPVLAVARWLQEAHGVAGLFDRLEALSVRYDRRERDEYEDDDALRLLFRVLLMHKPGPDGVVTISPGLVAATMNHLASAEHLNDTNEAPDDAKDEGATDGKRKSFTNPRRVGQMLKRQRFKRPRGRNRKGKQWQATRDEIVQAAAAFGVTEAAQEEDDVPDEDGAGEPFRGSPDEDEGMPY
jgi:hypothetical protein